MTLTALDLDMSSIPLTDPALDRPGTADDAKNEDQKAGLTPGTVNTYGMGIGACIPCC